MLPGASSSQEQRLGWLGSTARSRRAKELLCPLGWCQRGSLLLFSEPKRERERDQASQFSQEKVEFWEEDRCISPLPSVVLQKIRMKLCISEHKYYFYCFSFHGSSLQNLTKFANSFGKTNKTSLNQFELHLKTPPKYLPWPFLSESPLSITGFALNNVFSFVPSSLPFVCHRTSPLNVVGFFQSWNLLSVFKLIL